MVAIDLALMGPWSLLEGCNRVGTVYLYRALKALVLGVAIWVALLAGCGLYSLGLGYLAVLPLSIGMLRGKSWLLLRWLLSRRGHAINWKSEILPLHWRLAVSFGSGYFAQWGVTPITFKMFQPCCSGSVWSDVVRYKCNHRNCECCCYRACSAIWSIYSLKTVRGTGSSRLEDGCCIRSARLDGLWRRIRGDISVESNRFAPRGADSAAGTVTDHARRYGSSAVGRPLAVYLRSHKREPYLWLSAGFAVGVVLATCLGGRWFGPLGVAVSYFLVVTLFFVPFGTAVIFLRCRHR